MKTENEIRQIIQDEYDKNKYDTNYNFVNRFAKAVYESISAEPSSQLSEVESKIAGAKAMRDNPKGE